MAPLHHLMELLAALHVVRELRAMLTHGGGQATSEQSNLNGSSKTFMSYKMPAIPLLMFPREQIEFAMEEAGYETPSKFAKKLPEISKANIPKDIKGYRHISYKESAIKERSNGLARYWEIELLTREMQEKFCNLQDEFGAGMVIEDIDGISSPEIMPRDIGSERQERYAEEAVKEGERINKSWEKLKSLKDDFLRSEVNPENSQAKNEPL
uniref:Uncharacterized protein n=1 Tax=Salix viminalis TaxID=40686 RepID=A0A6N2LQC8_SALVM